jgi:tetratricopeptide (TPR) repeat protein
MAAVDIEPLLQRMTELAPRFGRAQEDLETLVSRGRAQDYKGVMQNARLVLEALLRSLIAEELKQTPGKAMLDELVTKFRQQANAGIIPTNVLAHMGTVQAWGNLSAHDHAGSLGDSGVKVGLEEVVASLNSMVAILTWYSEKKGLVAPPSTPTAAQTAAPPASKPPTKLIAAGVLVLAIGAAVALSLGGSKPTVVTPAPPQVDPFATLDTVYSTRKEPIPPAPCRRAADAVLLAKAATDVQALGLIEKPSPEAAYLLARATNDALKQTSPALKVALACPGFAAAEHLAGDVAVREGNLADAQKAYEEARRVAPGWIENRADLVGVLLKSEQKEAAAKEIEALIAAAPDEPRPWLLRGLLRVDADDKAGAAQDLCKASKLGSNTARSLLEAQGLKCP